MVWSVRTFWGLCDGSPPTMHALDVSPPTCEKPIETCRDAYRDAYRDAWMLTGLTGMPRDAEPQEPAAAAAAALSRQLPRRPSRPRTCEKAVSGGLLFVSGGVVSGI